MPRIWSPYLEKGKVAIAKRSPVKVWIYGMAAVVLRLEVRSVQAERRKSEAEKRQESTQAKVISLENERRVRERLISMMTHDIRNPLAAAKTAAEMILQFPSKNEQHLKLARLVVDNLSRVEGMVGDLLDVTRLRSGRKLALSYEERDLVPILEGLAAEYSPQIRSRIQLDFDGPMYGTWSPEGIRRSVRNLLSNAITHGDPGRPIKLCARIEDDWAVISVQNQGPVLTSEDKGRLFTPFESGLIGNQERKRGWGLGLTLVKGLVETQGGKVLVHSSPERGTIFSICLPHRIALKQVA